MLTFLGLTFILLSIALLFIFIYQRNTKLILVKSSPVIFVYGASVRYPNLPLKNYGIPLKINNQSRVQVLFPKLTPAGDVEYIYSWHDLSDIEIPQPTGSSTAKKLIEIQKLALIIKEHLQIEPEVLSLEEQYRRIKKLAYLVATSDIYAVYLDTYERYLVQINNLLNKADKLQKVYIRLIREALIGVKIAEYNSDFLEVSQVALDLQYQRIKEEYQNMKDVVNVYSQLLKESKNTQLRSRNGNSSPAASTPGQ